MQCCETRVFDRLPITAVLKIMAVLVGLLWHGVCRADSPDEKTATCIRQVAEICDRFLSNFVEEGNQGFRQLESLSNELRAQTLQIPIDDLATSGHSRAIAWGRCHFALPEALGALAWHVDARYLYYPDKVNADSSDKLGIVYPVPVVLDRHHYASAEGILDALDKSPRRQLSESQTVVLSMCLFDILARNPKRVETYFARCDRYPPNLRQVVVECHKLAGLAPPAFRAQQKLDDATDQPNSAQGGSPTRLAAADADAAIAKELAANIVALTTMGPRGELGLLYDVGDRIKSRLQQEIDSHFVAGLSLASQAESVKRSLLFLGLVRDEAALRRLVPFARSRIVLHQPGKDEPFRDVAVKEIICGYGEGMIDLVAGHARGTPEPNLSPQDVEVWTDCLVSAFGTSPADIRFLTTYIETIDWRELPSERKLIRAIESRKRSRE